MILNYLVGGWPTPLKNDGVKVNWDDEIPNWMESHNPFMFQTTKQCLMVKPQANPFFMMLRSVKFPFNHETNPQPPTPSNVDNLVTIHGVSPSLLLCFPIISPSLPLCFPIISPSLPLCFPIIFPSFCHVLQWTPPPSPFAPRSRHWPSRMAMPCAQPMDPARRAHSRPTAIGRIFARQLMRPKAMEINSFTWEDFTRMLLQSGAP